MLIIKWECMNKWCTRGTDVRFKSFAEYMDDDQTLWKHTATLMLITVNIFLTSDCSVADLCYNHVSDSVLFITNEQYYSMTDLRISRRWLWTTIFWNLRSCSPVQAYRRFWGKYSCCTTAESIILMIVQIHYTLRFWKILSRVLVTIAGDWIGEQIYWPLTGRNYR
jgi:hypothetical protein